MKTNSFFTTRKRLLIAIISITFLFCLLGVRLFYLQVISGNELTVRAAEQWYRDLPLKAKRGEILDRNGDVIADSKDVFTVYVRPRAVTDVEATAQALSEHLGIDKARLVEKIRAKRVSEITVSKNVEFSVGSALREMDLNGVYFSVDAKRSYTHSDYLAQVIGYVNADNEGQTGLEGYYDKLLRGVDGVSLTETDNSGVEIEDGTVRYIPAIDGADMKTTLDVNVQGFVENAVSAATAEWKAKSVSAIVMDVTTGGIVAMAKTPSYALDDIPRSDVDMLNAFSKNTMIVDVYEPGSTFKIFTTAAALECGVVGESNRFFCPGYRMVDGQRIKCWRSIGHGSQSLSEGVKNSCNCVFMDLALRLGTDRFYEKLSDFGIGKKTGVDFYSESSGIVMKQSAVKTVDLARIGFGQAVAVTPIQLISGVSAIVNGGVYHTPHFVENIVDTYGNEIFTFQDGTKRVLSEQTSAKMRELLEAVVSEGSGKKAGVEGYRIGGKTGTAQKYAGGVIAQGKYVSSFVGFAPADKPKYAVLLTVDEPSAGAYYGSVVAAPYVGEIFERIFGYESTPRLPSAAEERSILPWLDGTSVAEAVRELEKLGYYCEIDGDGATVKSTLPAGGAEVKKGDVILIYA